MSGCLYIVGTPIGNLSDFSTRAVEVGNHVDLILAEDTRVSIKLLNHFEIKKEMMSFHAHNEGAVVDAVINRLSSGTNVAIITDAGMPCISDPGEILVKACHENFIKIETVPGPTALMTALAASGQDTSRFVFEGFLSPKKKEREDYLSSIKMLPHTLLFYEAPHKLLSTLYSMKNVFGNRSITLARELTKKFEEISKTDIETAIEKYEETEPKGEFVLIVAGADENKMTTVTFEQALEEVLKLVESGEKLSDASKEISKLTGYKKRELYQNALNEEQEEEREE